MMNWQTIPALWLDLEFYYPHVLGAAGLLLKSAVIFSVATLVAKCLARRSARARNWLWRVTLTLMLALPCWNPFLRHASIFTFMPDLPLAVESRTQPVELYQKFFLINSDLESRDRTQAVAVSQDNPPWRLAALNVSIFQRAPWRWLENLALPLWLSVSVALLLAQVFRALAARRWLRRHARAADAQLAASAGALPLTVSLFLHRQLKSPLIIDGKTPRVYLPADAQRWSGTELRAVLLHELAHWQQQDLFWQKIGSLARAVWWWNPFARRAVAHMSREAELAADDAVLLAQIPAPDYAQTLVNIATRAADLHPLGAGIPFIGKQPLQQRVQTLLSPNRWRGKIGRLALTLIALLGIFTLLTVSVKVMWRYKPMTAEQLKQLSENWLPPPASLTAEQEQLATTVLAALKTRLDAQRYLHFKHEVRSQKQDLVSGRILFENATPGRMEMWIDEWRQNYRADVQPECDAHGKTIYFTVDTLIISDDKNIYRKYGKDDFHGCSRSELTFLFERLLGYNHAGEAARHLQDFLNAAGKNIYLSMTYEIGMTQWQDRSMIFFRSTQYSDIKKPPFWQDTYLFDPLQNCALVCHQKFDSADWELLASGTDADGQHYPQKYRVTEVNSYDKTTTVSEYDVTLFELLKELPKGLLARPDKVIMDRPRKTDWLAELFDGWTSTELLGNSRVPDYSIPAPPSLSLPTSVTPADREEPQR